MPKPNAAFRCWVHWGNCSKGSLGRKHKLVVARIQGTHPMPCTLPCAAHRLASFRMATCIAQCSRIPELVKQTTHTAATQYHGITVAQSAALPKRAVHGSGGAHACHICIHVQPQCCYALCVTCHVPRVVQHMVRPPVVHFAAATITRWWCTQGSGDVWRNRNKQCVSLLLAGCTTPLG